MRKNVKPNDLVVFMAAVINVELHSEMSSKIRDIDDDGKRCDTIRLTKRHLYENPTVDS